MSFISRVLAGLFADILRNHLYSFFLLFMMLTGIAITLFPLSSTFTILLVLIGIYGFFAGVSVYLVPVCTFEPKYLTSITRPTLR